MATCFVSNRAAMIGAAVAFAVAGGGRSAWADLYGALAQQGALSATATARVPGQADVTDSRTGRSNPPGDASEGIEADATNPPGAVVGQSPRVSTASFASYTTHFTPDTIDVLAGARNEYTEIGGNAGGQAQAQVAIGFIQREDAPLAVVGAITTTFVGPDSGNRQAGATVQLFDLDVPDDEGGPSVVFGRGFSTDFDFTDSFNEPGLLIAGHEYELRVIPTTTREILQGAPPGSDPRQYAGRADVHITLLMPEPGGALFLAPSIALLARRRRHRD